MKPNPEPITRGEVAAVLRDLRRRLLAPEAAATWRAIHETDESAGPATLAFVAMLAVRFNRKPAEGDIYK